MATITSSTDLAGRSLRTGRAVQLAGWALLLGGMIFLVGGPMHPGEDPPGASVAEHLHVMFQDKAWYPAHTLILIGTTAIALGLVGIARSGRLGASSRKAQVAVDIAATAAVFATVSAAVHLFAATEVDKILVPGAATPITSVQNVLETVAGPAFGFSIAALALIGASTRTLGNWIVGVIGAVGGIAYGLAAGTFLVTDALDPLFPLASTMAIWAIFAGALWIREVRRSSVPVVG